MTEDVHLRLGNAETVEGLDGKDVTVPCSNVFQLREGLVAGYRSYIDASPVYA
jgi:hypothetical protein